MRRSRFISNRDVGSIISLKEVDEICRDEIGGKPVIVIHFRSGRDVVWEYVKLSDRDIVFNNICDLKK